MNSRFPGSTGDWFYDRDAAQALAPEIRETLYAEWKEQRKALASEIQAPLREELIGLGLEVRPPLTILGKGALPIEVLQLLVAQAARTDLPSFVREQALTSFAGRGDRAVLPQLVELARRVDPSESGNIQMLLASKVGAHADTSQLELVREILEPGVLADRWRESLICTLRGRRAKAIHEFLETLTKDEVVVRAMEVKLL